jgi:hypothetical protein
VEIKNCDSGGVLVTLSFPFHHSHAKDEPNYVSDSPDRG